MDNLAPVDVAAEANEPIEALPVLAVNLHLAVTGAALLQYLQALLPGRAAKNQGYSYNRVIKVLNNSGHLPADFGNISYGVMKPQQRVQLHGILQTLSTESHGTDLFEKLKDAIANKSETTDSIKDNELEGGVVVNRWALMIEFYVHPSSRDELTRYFTKLTSDERPAVLTDGIANYKEKLVTELMRICMEEVAPNVRNCFVESWPALSSIHPENGGFPSPDIFLQLLGEVRSSFDVLKSNLSKSGTQESGAILDSTAFEFCKYGQRTCKLNHFYLWLKWKDADILFLSNNLTAGVAADGNVSTPYVRAKSTEIGSGKSSYSERKAAKASHSEKVIGSIGKTVAEAFLSLPSNSSSASSSARTAAYIAKEEQLTSALSLKRLRDTIEASSFSSFSPDTKTRIKDKYKQEVMKTFFE